LFIRLSGRQVRRGQVTASALLAGMWVLVAILDALQQYEMAELKDIALQTMLGYPRFDDG
jgi:hypothetical protein